jgi:hypothetical protein
MLITGPLIFVHVASREKLSYVVFFLILNVLFIILCASLLYSGKVLMHIKCVIR